MTNVSQTTRTEPTVATGTKQGVALFTSLGFGVKKEAHHTDILNDALQLVTDTQAKLEAAVTTIQDQIDADEKEIEARQGKVLAAGDSLSRLQRVKGRFAELIA